MTNETITSGEPMTTEQSKAVAAALEKRNTADYDAYQLLQQVMPHVGVRDDHEDSDVPDMIAGFQEEFDDIVERREQANDEFLKALMGR